MDVKKVDFKIKHDGAMVPVSLSIFKPKGTPLMYRLFVNIGKNGKVFILYPQDEMRTTFKYYESHNPEMNLLTEKLIKKVKALKV